MQIKLPTEIAALPVDPGIGLSKSILVETCIEAVMRAWEEGIRPRVTAIRASHTSDGEMKKGVDFFTEADVESERIVQEVLKNKFDDKTFRFFGEEKGVYDGNLAAKITIRIDPIDGTAPFKFGKPSWGIMVGAYTGRDEKEKQLASVTFFPEYYNEIVCRVDKVGVFRTDVNSGIHIQFEPMEEQNSSRDVLVILHRSNEFSKRGNINALADILESKGMRVRSGSPLETKEALETRGRRAFITQGDYDQVDFILYSSLVALGYKLYSFDGREKFVDNPAIAYSKFILVPPGSVGEMLREVVSATQDI